MSSSFLFFYPAGRQAALQLILHKYIENNSRYRNHDNRGEQWPDIALVQRQIKEPGRHGQRVVGLHTVEH